MVVVLGVLALVVVASVLGGSPDEARRVFDGPGPGGWRGVLQAGGLLFFAFAGYARIATLGEEVRDPSRTIPRAIPLALGITLVVYAAVGLSLLAALGPDALASSSAPLAEAMQAADLAGLAPAVRAGGFVAWLHVPPAVESDVV